MIPTADRQTRAPERQAVPTPFPPPLPEEPAVPPRVRRRYLPPLLRYAIIASWGVLLAVAVSYLLKKAGY